jgi:hypothetical protein
MIVNILIKIHIEPFKWAIAPCCSKLKVENILYQLLIKLVNDSIKLLSPINLLLLSLMYLTI